MKRLLRKLGTVAIVMVALILIKNEYARLLMSHASNGLQALITRSAENESVGEVEPYDLYMGSSMFRQGLDISELEDAGGNPYILAYNNAQPFLICKELEYLLQHDVPIRSLTVDMYVYTVVEEPWIEDTALLLDTDLGFKLDLWREMGQTDRASLADLWEMLVTSNNEKLFIWPVHYALVNPMFKDGGNLLENAGTTAEALGSGTIGDVSDAGYAMDDRQKYYLNRLIDLCNENEIALNFLETPKYYTVADSPAYIELMHLYCELLAERSVSYCLTEETVMNLSAHAYSTNVNNTVAETVFDQTNPSYYLDQVHLSSEGRRAFTQQYLNAIDQVSD